MFEIGAKSIIEKILPVVDNFERALSAATEEEKETPFVQGIDKIYKHMMTTLEEVGVKPIEAVGKEFDPNLHNAVMHDEDDEMDENIVSEEFQKGYMYKDKILRFEDVIIYKFNE
jgi:molecular chaperone GrpE